MPRLFDGVYGLGSRDFRPEHVLGAYEYATGTLARKDGRRARGRRLVHRAGRRPSLRGQVQGRSVAPARGRHRRPLPLDRRLGRHHHRQEPGRDHRRLQRLRGGARPRGGRAGPSQGGHPRQRQPQVRVGEEGRADVLLPGGGPGADPGQLRPAPRDRGAVLRPEGVHPHEPARRAWPRAGRSSGSPRRKPERAWERLPGWARKQILEKKIRVYTLPGFQIARKATDRPDLQLRMQGNAFLGAFFAVSPLLAGVQDRRRALPRGRSQAVPEEVRAPRRRGRELQHGGHDPGLRAGPRDPEGRARRPPTAPRCAAWRSCP